MKSIFRLYARTSKGNDQYLYEQLRSLGLTPKYQEIFHAFYFTATFNQLFDLSFRSFSIENLYIQLGQKFEAGTQKQIKQSFNKIPFQNYLPIKKGLIQNTTLNILIKQSTNIPSQSNLIDLLNKYLSKQIINRIYKKQIINNTLNIQHQYKNIKLIVQKKLQFDQNKRQIQNLKLLEYKKLQKKGRNINIKYQNKQQLFKQIDHSHQIQQYNKIQDILPYYPHLIFYIRKNKGRILLKVNKQELYKHGWKKNISWGAIRQTIVASALYQSRIIQQAKQKSQLILWDPFCGSGTIPLVAASLCGSLTIRNDYQKSFIWPYWSIFKQQYLDEYHKARQGPNRIAYKLVCSDISLKTVNHCIGNFSQLLPYLSISPNLQKWFNYSPMDQVFQLGQGSIYFACSHFEKILKNNINTQKNPINIFTNLPYLHETSSQHHQLNQLISTYKKFDQMLSQYQQSINNAYIFIGIQNITHKYHFLTISKERWNLLLQFQSGGLKIGLYAWSKNKLKNNTQIILQTQKNKSMTILKDQINNNLIKYRQKIKQINSKIINLPQYLKIKRNKGWRSTQQKRKDRHLKLAYDLFSRRKDKIQAYQQYSTKKSAIKLFRRGLIWKKKNIGLMKGNIEQFQEPLKKQFEQRIQYALKRQQERKKRKNKQQIKRIW